MNQILNQYSAIWIAAILALAAAAFVFRHKPRWQDLLGLGVIFAGLIAAWFILHPVQTPLMDNAKQVQEQIGQGKPVLLEFQSPY